MTYIAGHTAVESARRLARSALPDAPVVEDGPARPPRRATRARLSAVLRNAARWELRLADRLEGY